MSVYLSIKNSLISLLKSIYPAFDVLAEEISKTDDDDDSLDIENYFFIDIIPVRNVTVNEYHTERSLVIDIAGHMEAEKNEDYLIMADAIDSVVRPVFRFEDRAITIHQARSKIVDKVLHYTFDLVFIDTVDAPEPPPYMKELDIAVKERT